MASSPLTRVASSPLLHAVAVGILGSFGIAAAQDMTANAPLIVGLAAAVAIGAALLRWRGVATGAIGVAAAAAFATPDGLGPLLVATGALLACDVGRGDARLTPWRDAIDGLIVLPGLAGLAATAAAQPSERGLVAAAAAAVVVGIVVWRGPSSFETQALAPVVSSVGAIGAAALAIAPERFTALGDLPEASVQAGHSVAAGLAVFGLVAVALMARTMRGRVAR